MIDVNVGKTAFFLGKKYRCVESEKFWSCDSCAFFTINTACKKFLCCARSRKDHKFVQFEEIEKRE